MEPNSFQPHTDAFQDFCHVSPDRFCASLPSPPTVPTARLTRWRFSPSDEYGQFYSGIHTFSEVVPVFSPGKMPGSIDIRIPSGFYKKIFSAAYSYGYDKEQGTLDLENPADPPWEKKNDRIYCESHLTLRASELVRDSVTDSVLRPLHILFRLIFAREGRRRERWQFACWTFRLPLSTPTRPDRQPILRPRRSLRPTGRTGGRDRPRVGR